MLYDLNKCARPAAVPGRGCHVATSATPSSSCAVIVTLMLVLMNPSCAQDAPQGVVAPAPAAAAARDQQAFVREHFQSRVGEAGQVGEAPGDVRQPAAAEAAPVVRNQRRCATEPGPVPSPIRTRARQGAALLRQRVPNLLQRNELKQVQVRVRFIVIHNGDRGRVSEDRLKQQIAVLNDTFGKAGFSFAVADTTFHDVAAKPEQQGWFAMGHLSDDEANAKRELGKNQRSMLNFYTAEPQDLFGEGLLGWATFPSELAGNESRDGVVIHHATLPGGHMSPYNLGKTGTHEVGHWLGLYHTFQDGCTDTNDEVADTPAQSDSADTNGNGSVDIFECIDGLDTCEKAGLDPVHNYMNYPEDQCLREFTAGQIERMRIQVAAFRPDLIRARLPAPERIQLENAVKPFSVIE